MTHLNISTMSGKGSLAHRELGPTVVDTPDRRVRFEETLGRVVVGGRRRARGQGCRPTQGYTTVDERLSDICAVMTSRRPNPGSCSVPEKGRDTQPRVAAWEYGPHWRRQFVHPRIRAVSACWRATATEFVTLWVHRRDVVSGARQAPDAWKRWPIAKPRAAAQP